MAFDEFLTGTKETQTMSTKNHFAEGRWLDADIFSSDEREAWQHMLHDDVKARCKTVNQRDRTAWTRIQSRTDWERFYAPRIEVLRQSLGVFPRVPQNLNAQVTHTIEGDGYRIENIIYESRPGVSVTANLYSRSPSREKMSRQNRDSKSLAKRDPDSSGQPAIVIIHSHHNPKTQGELQDMGMTWARSGCIVLIIDQFGYGERRQHRQGPRQDYLFRYISGIQLHLIGDSLMGWMVWDVMRGIDLLLSRQDVDKDKVILIGAVAGGGDPAAVVAAIDSRITCVIPFNFGGPQPETTYPLPDDAEETFNYIGGGSWESTRNLRLSARDGFLPWVIVASTAPRHLIYAHEFSWDKARDPVWNRLQQVFAFYDASDNLAFTHGAGRLSGRPPSATHCNNVGDVHRVNIHDALQRWFDIPIPQEYQNRLSEEELRCMPPETQQRPLHGLFAEIGASRSTAMRNLLAGLATDKKREHLCQEWAKLLGNVTPKAEPAIKSHIFREVAGTRVERIVLEVEPHIVVPILLLLPSTKDEALPPVVVAVSQGGKRKFLSERSEEIAALLKAGIAVCLPDVRGTGETSPGDSRKRQSEATAISGTELMLGGTLLGARLRDLRSVLRYLRTRCRGDACFGLWGDSFAPTNPPNFSDPLIGEGESPHQSEPLGGLLALFGALYENDVCAVVMRGMIAGYQSVIRDGFCYIPHDVIVPGALTAGDLCDVAATLVPRPLRLEALVDGRNCPMVLSEVERLFEPTLQAYHAVGGKLSFIPTLANDLAVWFVELLTPAY